MLMGMYDISLTVCYFVFYREFSLVYFHIYAQVYKIFNKENKEGSEY